MVGISLQAALAHPLPLVSPLLLRRRRNSDLLASGLRSPSAIATLLSPRVLLDLSSSPRSVFRIRIRPALSVALRDIPLLRSTPPPRRPLVPPFTRRDLPISNPLLLPPFPLGIRGRAPRDLRRRGEIPRRESGASSRPRSLPAVALPHAAERRIARPEPPRGRLLRWSLVSAAGASGRCEVDETSRDSRRGDAVLLQGDLSDAGLV